MFYYRVGEKVLDMHLKPMKVMATNFSYLGPRKLFSFGESGPFFTEEHQFMTDDGATSCVVNLDSLLDENPQMIHQSVTSLTANTLLLRFNEESLEAEGVKLTEHGYSRDTKVYFIEVEGDGTYIVDNFVAKHELPNFTKWPLTFLTIGLTTQAMKLPLEASLEAHEESLPHMVRSDKVS